MGVQTVGGRTGPLTGEMIAGTRCSLCGARTRLCSNGGSATAAPSAKDTVGNASAGSERATIQEVSDTKDDKSDAYRDIYNQASYTRTVNSNL